MNLRHILNPPAADDDFQIPPLAVIFTEDPFAQFQFSQAQYHARQARNHSRSSGSRSPGPVRPSNASGRQLQRTTRQFSSMRISTGIMRPGDDPRMPNIQPRRPNADRPHSNKAYTVEQVDKTRYYKEDKNLTWVGVKDKFAHELDARGSNQCYSSRYYRDNKFPVFDENDCPILDINGKQEWLIVKVRDRSTQNGRIAELPYCLVDKHPERAVHYDWISEDNRERARNLLRDPEHVIRIRRTVTAVWRELNGNNASSGSQSSSSEPSTPSSSASSSRQASPSHDWQIISRL